MTRVIASTPYVFAADERPRERERGTDDPIALRGDKQPAGPGLIAVAVPANEVALVALHRPRRKAIERAVEDLEDLRLVGRLTHPEGPPIDSDGIDPLPARCVVNLSGHVDPSPSTGMASRLCASAHQIAIKGPLESS